MDTPGILATFGTQDIRRRQRKQKNTTQYILLYLTTFSLA